MTANLSLHSGPRPASSLLPASSGSRARVRRPRRISPQAGRALELLGHAIEYLTDEHVHEGGSLSGEDSRVKAIQLLMALNREVYFECPEIPTFGERMRSSLHAFLHSKEEVFSSQH